jgi:hypothetical protein
VPLQNRQGPETEVKKAGDKNTKKQNGEVASPPEQPIACMFEFFFQRHNEPHLLLLHDGSRLHDTVSPTPMSTVPQGKVITGRPEGLLGGIYWDYVL